MATKKASTKSVATEEVEAETTAAEPTTKQVINEGIARVAAELGVEAKNRYKVQRAIFFIAAEQAIADGTFDELLDATISGVDNLPSGFELERTVAEKPVKAPKAPAKKAPAKTAAPKAAARKRPTR